MSLISATVTVKVTSAEVSVTAKYNVGLGAFTDGTWNKSAGVTLPDRPDGSHKKTTGRKKGGGGGHASGGGNLRWKPISEKNKKLVVLIGVIGGTCTVNGEQGSYSGQTNGNRATFRFSKNGCAYGPNVKVVHSTAGSWTIPNGCSSLHGVKSDSAAAATGTTTTDNAADSNTNNTDVDDTTYDSGSDEGGGGNQ